jgi:hypothetical protein
MAIETRYPETAPPRSRYPQPFRARPGGTAKSLSRDNGLQIVFFPLELDGQTASRGIHGVGKILQGFDLFVVGPDYHIADFEIATGQRAPRLEAIYPNSAAPGKLAGANSDVYQAGTDQGKHQKTRGPHRSDAAADEIKGQKEGGTTQTVETEKRIIGKTGRHKTASEKAQ